MALLDKKIIGDAVRSGRSHLRLDLDELSQLTSIPQSVLLTIERGRQAPTLGQLRELCKVLDLGVDDLHTSGPRPSTPVVVVHSLSRELIAALRSRPEDVRHLEPRKFEELVAALLEDMGYDVELTPETHDHGRDILAACDTPLGRALTLVECKRYGERNRIGPSAVQRLLWVLDNTDRANMAVLVTTSGFTSGARDIERRFEWRLKLRDFDHLQGWLADYGRWTKRGEGLLWTARWA